jgi:spore maturation protein A
MIGYLKAGNLVLIRFLLFDLKRFPKVRVINLTQGGLKAMEELAKLEAERGTAGYADESGRRVASNEMCTFLILNISSLQLIPVNMIAYRSQYGSVNPAGIIAPAIVATFVSTAVAVVFCKMMAGKASYRC